MQIKRHLDEYTENATLDRLNAGRMQVDDAGKNRQQVQGREHRVVGEDLVRHD